MLGKQFYILIIFLMIFVGSAFAGYSFQPYKTLKNSTELNHMQINGSAINKGLDQALIHNLPLSFSENQGQISEEAKFIVKTSGQTIYFTPSMVLFAFSSQNNTSVIKMSFEGANPGQFVGDGLLPGKANYITGNDSSKWVTNVPTYGAVRYKDLYPGIDLIFKGVEGFVKHELVLNPGADPSKIVMIYDGQTNLSLCENGSVQIKTETGILSDSAPVCYQEINGSRVVVEGQYRILDSRRIGFKIGNYDPNHSLVIDPVLTYSSYFGGSGIDIGRGIAVDNKGYVYITGETSSDDFPVTASAYDHILLGNPNVFVLKMNPAKSGPDSLIYSTYIGGNGDDTGLGLALSFINASRADSVCNAYITGKTGSSNFPITSNAFQQKNKGGRDAFVTELNADGSGLIYSTYLSGSEDDQANGIAIDGKGNVYVTGSTSSIDFPTKNGYSETSRIYSHAAFVAVLNPSMSGDKSLIYSTYLGGKIDTSSTSGNGIAVDSSGNAYVTGETGSPSFPTTTNAYQTSFDGDGSAFVTKLNPAVSGEGSLVYSTYLYGANFNVAGNGIAVDSSRNAYVTGWTSSDKFPITTNASQQVSGGGDDAFITKLNADGTGLIYSTYLGGSDDDRGNGISVDRKGDAYVIGETRSKDFPIKSAFNMVNHGGIDGFITELSADGSKLIYSTYLGGSDDDQANGIAVDNNCSAYVTGGTYSNDINTTQNAYNKTFARLEDAFIAVVSPEHALNQNFSMGQVIDVSCAWVNGGLHVCAVDSDGGLWHTIRHADGSWNYNWEDVKAVVGDIGYVKDVSCVEVNGELHVCAVVAGGHLTHIIRHADGSWTGLGDVKTVVDHGYYMGYLVAVSCAGINGELQVCAVNSAGRLMHIVCHADGSWTGWDIMVPSRFD